MRILVRGALIEWGTHDAKMKHFTPHLNLAADLVKSGGLKFSDASLVGEPLNNFKRVLTTFKRCYMEVSESSKREILKMMLIYLRQLNEQAVSQIVNGTELLEGTDFLHVVTSDLIAMLKDYYDSVRDQACQILEYMMTHFLRKSPISDTSDLLQMLKATATMGIPE